MPIDGIKNKNEDSKFNNTKYVKNINKLKKGTKNNNKKEKTKINEYTSSIEKNKKSNNKKNYKMPKNYAIETMAK